MTFLNLVPILNLEQSNYKVFSNNLDNMFLTDELVFLGVKSCCPY